MFHRSRSFEKGSQLNASLLFTLGRRATCARGAPERARGGVGRLYPTNLDGTPGDDAEAPFVT